MNELGTYIKEKRIEKGLSIRRLAELADISHTEVKRIEDGLRKQTSPQVLRSIAYALSVPYEDLMAAAGYIDEPATELDSGTIAAGIKDTEDLTESLQLYDAVVNEAQNRFPAVQLVRLPVRT